MPSIHQSIVYKKAPKQYFWVRIITHDIIALTRIGNLMLMRCIYYNAWITDETNKRYIYVQLNVLINYSCA